MSGRPSIPARVQVAVAISQAEHGGIICPLCGTQIIPSDKRVLEHMVPRMLGGSDEAENLRWVHHDCAKAKTNGNNATSADGDLHKIAKAKRLERARQAHEDAVLGKMNPEKSYTYVKRLSRPIPSRPFPKRIKTNANPT